MYAEFWMKSRMFAEFWMKSKMFRRILKPALCILGAIIIFTYLYHESSVISRRNKIRLRIYEWNNINRNNNSKLKFVLQWNHSDFPCEIDEDGFLRNVCVHANCVITRDRYLLDDVTKYDAILFYYGYEPLMFSDLPETRSPHQKYVFTAAESSHNFPCCHDQFDGFFNWTWTYRLDSDKILSYFRIKDSNNSVIGPRTVMHWMKIEDMEPLNEKLKAQLKAKNKAVSWFVSNCEALSGRHRYADRVKMELAKYNLTLDVYGKCGPLKCEHYNEFLAPDCDELITKKYYFYLSFENSLSEDYVTEKLLRPLIFGSVPIVYGYANYTRFMPDGIYLNAYEMSPEVLAAKMNQLILNPEEYYSYFKWRNHYSYHVKGNEFCRFCAMLNDEERMKKHTIVQNFSQWWDIPKRCEPRFKLWHVVKVASVVFCLLVPYPFLWQIMRMRYICLNRYHLLK